MAFGNRIKNLRTEKRLTQKELADALSLGESTISFYESDKREPDYDTLNKIADFFSVSVDFLMGRTQEKETENVTNFTYAAHRSDNPRDDLPEPALRSLWEFENFIRNQYGKEKISFDDFKSGRY